MAVKPVLHIDNQILRKKTLPVSKIDRSVLMLVDDLLDTLEKLDGVGLAAPQIGVSLRVAALWMPENDPIILINPVIIKRIGTRCIDEGCLSLPGYQGNVKRSVSVTAKWIDLDGRSVKIRAEDLMAQALEHEIDHLDGVLFTDHMESPSKLHKVEPKAPSESDSEPHDNEGIAEAGLSTK